MISVQWVHVQRKVRELGLFLWVANIPMQEKGQRARDSPQLCAEG